MGEVMQREKGSQQQIEDLVRVSSEGVVVVDTDGVIQFANPAAERLLAKAPGAVIGYHLGCPATDQISEMRVVRGVTDVAFVEMRCVETTWEGEPAFVINLHDVTERRHAEEALRKSQELLIETGEMAKVGGWEIDLHADTVSWTRTMNAIHEVPDDYVPTLDQVIHFFGPEARPQLAEAVRRAREEGVAFDLQLPFVTARGRSLWVRVVGKPELREGKCTRLHGTFHDISQLKEAVDERIAMEAKFYQAQKMESIGVLAGGVAHDFNNLLTTIIGNAQLAMTDLETDDPLYEDIGEIKKAAERGSLLVRRLLAFSRKERSQPELLDLNDLIQDMSKLIRRLIRENIKLEMVLTSEPLEVLADPGQMEQVVMNLVVNARDVMLEGGELTIETANTTLDAGFFDAHEVESAPGRYVVLAITDSGSGMDKATQARIFEPFFTTKERESGTGLGLSTVYGIVKQHKGYIWPYSEPGKGTTMKIYLPRHDEEGEEKAEAIEAEMAYGHGEIILVVEDDAPVLALAQRILTEAGYRVLAAQGAGEAIEMARQPDREIHLLLTDMVMPEMSGRELADEVLALRPETKILFMSGYANITNTYHKTLEKGFFFIEKPFTFDGLARKVREALGARNAELGTRNGESEE